ncbi:autotransporter domain-containing protein [Bradyrhizobium sp. CCGUVB1N3]|uniref:autotransporter outer membrane beta-barrel domain-containing protein n=1 Tax=Bradyrhizobium sp. CCGUVB1N3 TaxID=2949629 RepID=UPI0020B40427|nr:autotransporter domain-containing protein [Bradyrhizobium sp. CCGUVB1N3]MCP3469212.1 autotransporter domain-containing protein [Bradyrhizobium sp. CCGUVB1N3]
MRILNSRLSRLGGAAVLAAAMFAVAPAAAQTVIPAGTTVTVSDPTTAPFYYSGVQIDGSLVISNGALVYSGNYSYIATTASNTGTLSVDGSGSIFDLYYHDLNVATATGANAVISVTNGGTIQTYSNVNTGLASGTTTTITVDGAGSTFTTGFQVSLSAAAGSVTTLNISNGGTFYAQYYQCCDSNGSGVIFIGVNGTATVSVTGTNSLLRADGNISIGSTYPNTYGSTGTGVLTLSDGGTVMAGYGYSGLYVATNAGSTGTINIGSAAGSAATAPGYVTASLIQFGDGNGSIVFNHTSDNYVFSTPIYGAGSLTNLSGTTVLTGFNAYTGATTVAGGVLDVEGSIAGSATTVTGGTLTGAGTVGDVTVANGGVLAPGTPGVTGSTLTVSGNLVMQAGSTYQVAINPTTASIANVQGTATLGGTVLASFGSGTYTTRTTYEILQAWSIVGTFSGVTGTNPNFSETLSYSPYTVSMTVSASLGGGSNLNANQQAVANQINTIFNNGGSLPSSFLSLFGLTGSSLTTALSQATGESATGTQQGTFNAMSQFMGAMMDPSLAGRGDPAGGTGPSAFADERIAYASSGRSRSERDAYAAMSAKAPVAPSFEQRWSVWASAFGGSQTTSGNVAAGSNNTSSSLYGTAVGADYRFSPNTVAGFALAGGGTNFSVNGLGYGRSDLFQAGAFVRHTIGPAYISAALAYGWQDITTDRTVTIAGVDHLRAQFNANAWSGRLEGGYRFVTQSVGLTPYAAGQFTTFDLPAYAEQVVSGANTFALAYGSKSVTDTRSELGLRADRAFAADGGIFTLRGRLAWAHDFNPDRAATATFQSLPGASFVVNGAALASDSALVTASAEKKWLNGWSAATTFEGEFSNVTRSYAGKGVVRYAW